MPSLVPPIQLGMPPSTPITHFRNTTSMRKFYPSEDEVNEFTFSVGGQAGVNLQDAYKGNVQKLDGIDDPMFPKLGMKVTYIVQLFDKKYTKQKYAQRSSGKGTITREKVTKQVAQIVWDAMREHLHLDSNHSTAPLRPWYLMALKRVGKSSFACLLGQELSVEVTHAEAVDNAPSTPQSSTTPPAAHVAASLSSVFSPTTHSMSLDAETISHLHDLDAAF